MSEKLTEQLPVRLTKAQREYLQREAKTLKLSGTPGRVTEGDIMRALINNAMRGAERRASLVQTGVDA